MRGRRTRQKPDDLLLSGPDGVRLTNHNARRAVDWEVLRTAIGRPDLRMHDLRHTFATILFDAGASARPTYRRPWGTPASRSPSASRAREGVALRAGAVLDQALGGGTGKGAGAGRKGKSGRGNGQNGPHSAGLGRSGASGRKKPDPPRL
jgi:hypothetical protein